jgi:hypothetical protein
MSLRRCRIRSLVRDENLSETLRALGAADVIIRVRRVVVAFDCCLASSALRTQHVVEVVTEGISAEHFLFLARLVMGITHAQVAREVRRYCSCAVS